MHRLVPLTAAEILQLSRCAVVFVPSTPARTSRFAFWNEDGTPPEGPVEELTVALPGEEGTEAARVPARVLSVREALPVLARARVGGAADSTRGAADPVEGDAAHPAAAFWGAAALFALQLTARGLLLPGLTAQDEDAWRAGPFAAADLELVRELAAAMPPQAHAVPLPGTASASPPNPEGDVNRDSDGDGDGNTDDGDSDGDDGDLLLPEPEALLRQFLDAVADTLPRSPAAPLAAGHPGFAAQQPQHLPEQRAWAADVAAGHDAGVRLSLRIEVPGLQEGEARFRAVLQMHSAADPSRIADAADVWAESAAMAGVFGPRSRLDALLALRRAARAWAPLAPLLTASVPDRVELADEEIADLLGEAAQTLAGAGVEVHWPRALARRLTARAVVGPPEDGRDHTAFDAQEHAGDGRREQTAGDGAPSMLSPDALLAFNWRFAVGDQELTRAELDALAESRRPLVRLRDRWVLIDPEEARRARAHEDRKVTPVDALGAVLTGSTEIDGRRVEVAASGWLAALRDRLADPGAATEVAQPAALAATLRDYQLRGLGWLAQMTDLGLGGCLADDMGLGKTITLISLHLHRQQSEGTRGPSLVVCPTSLMGNWQREIEKFAPGTPVRRFHGQSRSLDGLTDDGFVLTTYGTMRLDAATLASRTWGMVVADEAQHVKNPYSATAKELRTLPAKARVALTGTPVENNLSELWAILDWTTPGLLGRLGTFRNRYAHAVESGSDPAAAERLSKLVRPFLLRRRKSDPGIAPELPPKTETDRAVSLTAEQTGLYEAVVRETLAAIAAADGMERRGMIVKLLTGLKQICNHPAQYLKEERPVIPGRSGKLELLDELLDTILAEEAGVLVFTQYVQMARLLERHLAGRGVRTQFLHGGTPVAEREAMVGRFQDGEVPVFLLSLKAAGTGLNLTRAEHVVHYDRWWNPAVEAQATDRAYRIGQTRPVQVHRLITEGTIEDRIAWLLERKQDLADSVLGSGEAALTELTDAELAELVQLRGEAR